MRIILIIALGARSVDVVTLIYEMAKVRAGQTQYSIV